MIEPMRQHSQINRANLLDWLRDCNERAAPMPSDGEIAARFGFDGVETARTLLADLADRGEIRISHPAKGERVITISPVKPSRATIHAARPEPSIKHPTRTKKVLSEEEGLERIKAILSPPKPAPVAYREPAAPPVEPKPQPVLKVVPPAPPPAKVVETPPVPAPVRERPRKGPAPRFSDPFNLRLRPGALERLKTVAAADGVPLGLKAREMLEAALNSQVVPLDRKPVVPVAVLMASIEAGRGLHEFVSDLIAIGLEVWREKQTAEAAE